MISETSNSNFDWFNQGANYSWIRTQEKRYVHAYYLANATQWASYNNTSGGGTEIPTSEYTITSNDADVTISKADGGITYPTTYILTRTSASVFKQVTLTITVGSGSTAQTYTQVVNLTD